MTSEQKETFLTLLKETQERIKSRRHWVQDYYCQDKEGDLIYIEDPKAYKFCLTGSLMKSVCGKRQTEGIFQDYHTIMGDSLYKRLYALLWDTSQELYGISPESVNDGETSDLKDHPIKAHHATLKILDTLIKEVETYE